MGWELILAYVCFGLGGVLILAGLVRITCYGCAVSKDKKERKKNQEYYNFNTHKTDPWLKSNPLVDNRLEVSHVENDSLRDIDIQPFHKVDYDIGSLTESQRGGTEHDVEHVYHSFPNQAIIQGPETRLDSDAVNRHAHYVEPNTNLVLARKHQQAENLQEILQETAEPAPPAGNHPDLHLTLNIGDGKDEKQGTAVVMNGEPMSARSLDTREAFEALDYATAGEPGVTPRSDALGVLPEEGESPYYSEVYAKPRDVSGSTTPTTISVTRVTTSNEPLPVGDEVEYDYEHAITSF